jgi:hypothetical protein
MILSMAIASIVAPVNTLVSVTSCNHVVVVGRFVTATSPLLATIVAAIHSATRVIQVL